jgi:hypothetical protein
MEPMENKDKDEIQYSLFKEGANLIFKKWPAFRVAIDNNPKVLTYMSEEDDTQFELNYMVDNMLLTDIMELTSRDSGTNLEYNVADALYAFISEYFDIELEDHSEIQIGRNLIKLCNELKKGQMGYLEKLREMDKNISNSTSTATVTYSIEFPLRINKSSVSASVSGGKGENKLSEEFKEKVKIEDEQDEEGFTVAKKGKKFK